MTAEFFLAVRAVQATVGGRGKALGVQPIGDLPSQKKRQSASEQAVCIPACHKRKRCEHHGKIPVVDTAGVQHRFFIIQVWKGQKKSIQIISHTE